MSDLAEFLLAQLAEDEAAARKAEHSPYLGALALTRRRYGKASAYEHIARHDPARVLAECAAKRRIVELHQSWPVLVETPPEFSSDTSDLNSVSFAMSQRMMWLTAQEYRARFGDEPPTTPILLALVQPYEGAPGWDPAWKVSRDAAG